MHQGFIDLIQAARGRALQAVNVELVGPYWRVGEHLHHRIEAAEWGEGVVEQITDCLAHRHPDLTGFTRANLFRIRRFFAACHKEPRKVTALLRQLPWTHNLSILGRCKATKQRAFYLRQAAQEKWTTRELERQIKAGLWDHGVMPPTKVSSALRPMHPKAHHALKECLYIRLSQPAGEAP